MAPKKCYTPHQMGLAMEAVRRGESCSSAAKKYGVPRMTLRNKVTGKSPATCSMGPSTILSRDEESLLVQWLLAMADRHCPVGKEQLIDSVQHILKTDKRENPFTNDRPGRKWYNLFLNRHPEISERLSQNLTTSRENVNEKQINQWFSEVEKYLQDNQLSEIVKDPSRVFNADETAFFLNPKPGRVLVKKGNKNIYSTSGNEKENLTVLFTTNAAGDIAPPMVVFSYDRIPRDIAESIPSNWGIGRSETGWMCASTFYEYIANIFHPWLLESGIPLPIIFFLDGHASHVTKHLSDFCAQHDIEIVVLYPNSTHLLQPMDVAIFRPLKRFWKQETTKWKTQNLGQQVKKHNFAPILKHAIDLLTADSIKNGFRAGGLFPFGPNLIDFTKLNINNRSVTTRQDEESRFQQNITFLLQLEQEIVKLFTQSKLNTFNKCFYLSATDLETELPKEDLTMYMIWAKYKHLCQVVGHERNVPLEESRENVMTQDNIEEDVSNRFQAAIRNVDQSEILAAQTTPSKHEKTINGNHTPIKKNPSTSATFVNAQKPPTTQENTRDENHTAVTNLPSTSLSFADTMLKDKGVVVPSPFKKALFWPDSTTQKKRRISKEKNPTVITSKAWREFHDKKESEKKAKEEAKEQRKQNRLEKKKLKEESKIITNKNKTKKRIPCRRKRRSASTTSSDTAIDSDVTYVETGESDVEMQTDEDIPLTELKSKPNNEKRSATVKIKKEQKYSEIVNKDIGKIHKKILNKDQVNIKDRSAIKVGRSVADISEAEMDIQSKPDLKEKIIVEKGNSQGSTSQQVINFPNEDVESSIPENIELRHESKDLDPGKRAIRQSPVSLESPVSKVIVEELPQIESIAHFEPKQQHSLVSPNKLLQDRLTIDDYVLVTWNERLYPGQIISMSQEGVLVSCMKKSKLSWRWPTIKDIQLYEWDRVVCQIAVPTFIKKGYFKIPEMDE
ncbi:uncharacterized protein LOC126381335 [Pectinophora gossypiella]|uniref:uncharacterized protein LOC126381335 n=1 Tax=Pectinophora gossypiella TaxID=13191 RepID=UPI00214EBF98|nr:uncharacterized protein LOC126381335 [Pectinophora gossypiella]